MTHEELIYEIHIKDKKLEIKLENERQQLFSVTFDNKILSWNKLNNDKIVFLKIRYFDLPDKNKKQQFTQNYCIRGNCLDSIKESVEKLITTETNRRDQYVSSLAT